MIYKMYMKRSFDIILSTFALIALSPLFLIISILILFIDGRPIIYKQYRIGKNGSKFWMYKFRTMIKNADKIGPMHTDPKDSRVTKLGHKLRDWSLDELPQLINILKGDMSIIGPRPHIYSDYQNLSQIEKDRLVIRPGLACLVDINGRSSVSQEQRFKFDIEYKEKCNLFLDIKIILGVIWVVLKKENVNSSLKKNNKSLNG